jgi:hypothetical protein
MVAKNISSHLLFDIMYHMELLSRGGYRLKQGINHALFQAFAFRAFYGSRHGNRTINIACFDSREMFFFGN